MKKLTIDGRNIEIFILHEKKVKSEIQTTRNNRKIEFPSYK